MQQSMPLTRVTGTESMIGSSGDRQFDAALALTLSRISDVFNELPGFAFCEDPLTGNAYATTLRRSSNPDGTVLFGIRLLRALQSRRDREAAVTAICAHEFGHIVQFKHRLLPRLLAGQTTVKRLELHADVLAGFYAGTRKLQKPDYPATAFVGQARAFGDDNPNDRQHHGRGEERAAAVARGFELAYRERRSLSDAVRIGIDYVTRL